MDIIHIWYLHFLTSVLLKKETCRLWFLYFLRHARKFISIYIYKNIKNTNRNPKKLPECHYIGKRLKYSRISRKIMKMPLAALVAYARLLLEAASFSGEISVQPMVYPGRSDVEDSDGGGLDGRWWLMSENRRLEASVADENRGPFLARWGGKHAANGRGFAL